MQSKSTTGFGKISGVLAKDGSYKGLIFGSSRASRHISPDILGKDYFNLGADGMESSYQLGLAKILEYNDKLPEVAILTIDESEWFDDVSVNDINHLAAYYDVPYVRNEINKIGFSEKFKFLFGTYRYNGKIPSLLKNYLLGSGAISNGYNPLLKSTDALDRVKLMKKSAVNVGRDKINADVIGNFEEMIRLFNSNGTVVYLLKMPSLYDISNDSRKELDLAIRSLNTNIISVNESEYSDISLWEDLVHMNRHGAQKISNDILNSINDN